MVVSLGTCRTMSYSYCYVGIQGRTKELWQYRDLVSYTVDGSTELNGRSDTDKDRSRNNKSLVSDNELTNA